MMKIANGMSLFIQDEHQMNWMNGGRKDKTQLESLYSAREKKI